MKNKIDTFNMREIQINEEEDNVKSSLFLPQMDEIELDLFKAIAGHSCDWESWIDPQGIVKWVNPAVERITGYTPGKCQTMQDYPLSLIHKKDIELFSRCMRKVSNGVFGNGIEVRILHKDGNIRWGAVSWQSITDDNNNAIGYRISVRDITNHKITEKELLTAKLKAERANKAKSRFLATTCHDLRQTVQAIGMFASALNGKRNYNEQKKFINSIIESVHTSNELLNDLLDISRLDSDTIKPGIKAFAIADILELVENEFTLFAQNKNLELRTVPSRAIVKSDPILVKRIIRNFLSNALHYTTNGKILLGCRHKQNTLRVEVHDTGIGIAQKDQKAIFDEFHQLDNPGQSQSHGYGLGLTIIKRIAKILDINVTMESTEGKGSVFFIELPLIPGNINNNS